ncbi:hypothetical protein [Aureimonas pseudogalii]|uniref:Uncharacterized protein n=1 Tax=Aureimonas pseudogalii TaxID=1744844 RepID=A0A7W6MLF3_9HYPH|nr:hypothetical protein [Aureimonas pseudogalii]MBB3999750.1 hypothetical protein [Aureimonas pseudogalii]
MIDLPGIEALAQPADGIDRGEDTPGAEIEKMRAAADRIRFGAIGDTRVSEASEAAEAEEPGAMEGEADDAVRIAAVLVADP